MIIANLATYPPRRHRLESIITALCHQVDLLNIVLNEYEEIPSALLRLTNVRAILPDIDYKDVGKFHPVVGANDLVFLVDDDLNYPHDYVSATRHHIESLGSAPCVYGYHGTVYAKPRFGLSPKRFGRWLRYGPHRILEGKDVYRFGSSLGQPTVVDQIGTGTAVLAGHLMPPMEYMLSSRKFVDVRMARWCFERSISMVCLPRREGWLSEERQTHRIFDFTRSNPVEVSTEVAQFAFRNPNRGQVYRP
jgi:hypothetical protein